MITEFVQIASKKIEDKKEKNFHTRGIRILGTYELWI